MKYLVGWLEEMPDLRINGKPALELKAQVFDTREEAERFLQELEHNPKADPFDEKGFTVIEQEE